MTRTSARSQPFGRLSAALALSVCLVCAGFVRAEDASVREDRINGLIEALNAPSDRRARTQEVIYTELRGPDGREMHEAVREALFRPNSLILQGAIESLAMLGDARDVPNLEALLATTDKLEVKTLALRLLPAFCLSSERARFNYIQYAAGYERVPRAGILDPLRRPPLSRRGRLETSLEQLQTRVIRSLASQFDPVGAALRYIDDLLYGTAARQTVSYFVGNSLGNDPGRWARIWVAQGGDMSLRVPEEVEEVRLSALLSLSDMGAEGLPEVIDAFRTLKAAGGEVLQQAAFDAMTVMCRTGFEGAAALAGMHFSAEDAVEAENWRQRRYASNAKLAVFTAESAEEALEGHADTAVFTSAAAALGAALSYPQNFPDPDEILAGVQLKGLEHLERLLMMPDLSREKRASVALALGEIGAERAVSVIASVIDSPYCSPEFGADGARLAESAIDALRNVAVGDHEGRDAARDVLLGLLEDDREFPPLRAGTPPVGLAHMVLWRMQRLARSNNVAMDPGLWRTRLGW